MKKFISFSLIIFSVFAIMSCDKDNNNEDNSGANQDNQRLLKSVTYDDENNVVSTEEWTYGYNYRCQTITEGTKKQKTEYHDNTGMSTEQKYEWQGSDWQMTYERVTRFDTKNRPVVIDITWGNPSTRRYSTTYTYSGDSTICIIYENSSEPTAKQVIIHKGGVYEYISYSYAGNYAWKENNYSKQVTTYYDEKKGKISSTITYDRDGKETSRQEYTWNGESYKIYRTENGVKMIQYELTVDGDNSTSITYSTTSSDSETPTPLLKGVTNKKGNVTERYSYHYYGEWVLYQKTVQYYE